MTRICAVLCALAALLPACNGDDSAGNAVELKPLTREELMKPETCKGCHPNHYREWSASMHAYATVDPVFLAMNKRGQREAKLGKFCVNCHAPMAVVEQPDTDWTKADPSALPEHLQGVTCYFCHNAIGVDGDHNNMIRLANDTTMRASIADPVNPKVHGAAYSEFHDREKPQSTVMCGGCHDIQTPKGVNLERTFGEYQGSLFSHPDYAGFQTCQGCHMPKSKDGVVAENFPGVGSRPLHEHLWPAVDVPLTDWPHREALKAAIEECALPNSVNMYASVRTDTQGQLTLAFETNAGHRQPSGASADRRMWLEFTSKDTTGQTIYDTGAVADGAPEVAPKGEDALSMFNDTIFGEDGKEVHMFWDAAPSAQYEDGFTQATLPELKTAVAGGHSSPDRDYFIGLAPASAEMRMRVRPMSVDLLQDLVDSKDLDPAVIEEMPTFTVHSELLEWAGAGADPNDFTRSVTSVPDCDRYKCMLDPTSDACDTD